MTMSGTLAELLHAWHDFYTLIGTAAATLIGLMIVAASIASSYLTERNKAGVQAFFTPTVAHFAAVLIMCVVLGNGSKEHVATVEALVKAGANVDIKDRSGNTALAHARARNYTEMVKIMEPAVGRKTMLQQGTTL